MELNSVIYQRCERRYTGSSTDVSIENAANDSPVAVWMSELQSRTIAMTTECNE